jgi:hypothetical protein
MRKRARAQYCFALAQQFIGLAAGAWLLHFGAKGLASARPPYICKKENMKGLIR